MKNAVILFKKSDGNSDYGYIEKVCETLRSGGFTVDILDVLPTDDGVGFKKRFSYLRDTIDNVVVIAGNQQFDVKAVIAETLGTELAENENALKVIGIAEKDDVNGYALMPTDATLIPNPDGAVQGFLCEDEEFTLAFLPFSSDEFSSTCENFLLPYFAEKYSRLRDAFTFKYFGDVGVLESALSSAFEKACVKAETYVKTVYGDSLVKVFFGNEDSRAVTDAKRYIAESIGGRIYAEEDVTLGERLFDILKLKNLKISVAESFTGGRVISEIIKNSGASSVVYEGVVAYSNDSKIRRLGVREGELSSFGAVSSRVAYKMAAGLLNNGGCDVAISTTGIAGPKSDNTDKPVGLNYIAVGLKDGVHVYKYEFNGTREEITETAKNTALFLAIKKLKKL